MEELMRRIARALSLGPRAIVQLDLEEWAAGMVEHNGRYR
jgi:hypothetical protein